MALDIAFCTWLVGMNRCPTFKRRIRLFVTKKLESPRTAGERAVQPKDGIRLTGGLALRQRRRTTMSKCSLMRQSALRSAGCAVNAPWQAKIFDRPIAY